MLALHVTVCAALVELMLVLLNLTGVVQLRASLTGEPKAYTAPCVVPM